MMNDNNLGYEVWTPAGWQSFAGIAVMGINPTRVIEFDNGTTIEASEGHFFVSTNGCFVKVVDLSIGDELIGEAGPVVVEGIVSTNTTVPTYSLIEVDGGHVYYTDGIASKNCEFVSDDLTLINPLCLSRLNYKNPLFFTGHTRWFKEPEANKTYVVGLDPSLGVRRDYAAIQVFEVPGMIQVAEWQHNETVPRGQIAVLMQILNFIDQTMRDDPNQAGEPDIYWTVENNSIGEAVLQIIEDTGEERFPGQFISERKRKGQTRRFRKGLNTDNKKKLSACAKAKSLIESDRLICNSHQLIKELKFFVGSDGGGTFKAKPGATDDLVSSMLLCIRMLDTIAVWGEDLGDLKEFIHDDEIFEQAPMPIVL